MVAWQAAGTGRGAFEHALAYATRRRSSAGPSPGSNWCSRPDAGEQFRRRSRCAARWRMREEQVSLAKMYTTTATRETVG